MIRYSASHTAGLDYNFLVDNITFPVAAGPTHTMCSNLTILEDSVIENEEIFLVLLEASDPRVSVTEENSRVLVVISDNDDGLWCLIQSTIIIFLGIPFQVKL